MRKCSLFAMGVFIALLYAGTATSQNLAPYWSLSGNNNSSGASKLGTTTNVSLGIYTNNLQRILINSAGNVGVGTATPLYKLHVIGNALISTGLRVSNNGITATNTTGIGVLGTGSDYGLYGTSTAGTGIYGIGNNYGIRGTANSTTGTGIYGFSQNNTGVSGKGDKFGVLGNGSGAAGVGVLGSGILVGVKGINYSTEAASYGVFGSSNYTIGVRGEGAIVGVNGVGLDLGNGNFGIGVSGRAFGPATAVYALAERGVGVRGYSQTNYGVLGRTDNNDSYAGFFEGRIYTTGLYLPSDYTLKTDIADLGSAMEILSKLHPKSYKFRHDGKYGPMNLPDGEHYGLIVQDMEKLLPGLVKASAFETNSEKLPEFHAATNLKQSQIQQSHETIKFNALNYLELIPVIIKGMQEQQAENAVLKKELAELRNNLLQLKNVGRGTNFSANVAYLENSVPNPVNGSTVISYYVPESSKTAKIVLTNVKGAIMRILVLNKKGKGQLNFDTFGLTAGTYNYTLYMDGQNIDSKQLIIIR